MGRREPRRSWGDPKWTMRRSFVIAICGFAAVVVMMSLLLDVPPERINSVAALIGSLSVIVMPVIISYLGIAEAGAVIRELKAPSGTTISSEVRETVVKRDGEGVDAATRANARGEGA